MYLDVVLILLWVILIICIIGLLFLVVLEFKNSNTLRNHMKVFLEALGLELYQNTSQR